MILAGSGFVRINGRQMSANTERISDKYCTSSSLPFHRWAQVFHQQRKWPHQSQNVIIFSSITFKVKFGLVTSSLSWIIRCMFYYFNSFTLNQTTPWIGVMVICLKLLLCVSLLVIAKLHSKQYNILIVISETWSNSILSTIGIICSSLIVIIKLI